MNAIKRYMLCTFVLSLFAIHTHASSQSGHDAHDEGHDEHQEEGPNGGRLLESDHFALELVLHEGGGYPEYRIFAYDNDRPIAPENVQVEVELHRLGDVVDAIAFDPENGYLKGDREIYEPHSFEVHVNASYAGKTYDWHFDSFEGRTVIPFAVADAMGVSTEVVGERQLEEVIPAWGRVVSTAQGHQEITARFDGVVSKLHVDLGDNVRAGDVLVDIESNQSLKNYSVRSPISGVVDELYTSEGANTQGQLLMTVMDLSKSRSRT